MSNRPSTSLHLSPGDRLVFLGDSLTSRGALPGGYVTLVAEAVHRAFPDGSVQVFGAGVSGDRVPGCLRRLDHDVLRHRPTIVFIYIGINDVWHWDRGMGTGEEEYGAGLRDLVARIQAAGARVILATPSVVGEKTEGTNPRDGMLETYAGISRGVCEETGSHLLDLRRSFLEYLNVHNPENRKEGILTGDGVHLNGAGNRFVAEQVIRVLGLNQFAAGIKLENSHG